MTSTCHLIFYHFPLFDLSRSLRREKHSKIKSALTARIRMVDSECLCLEKHMSNVLKSVLDIIIKKLIQQTTELQSKNCIMTHKNYQ